MGTGRARPTMHADGEAGRAPGLSGRVWLGIGLALLAALGFSGTTISAMFAYEGGANPLAVITVRFVIGTTLLVLLLAFTGVKLRLPRRDRAIALAMGLFLAAQSYFLYASFERIPVGLTMVIFYVYPLMVALTECFVCRQRFSPLLWVALVTAFLGLVMVFNLTGEGLEMQGAIYAVLAGLGWGVLTLVGARVIRGDSRPVTLHMQFSAAVTYLLICLVSGDVVLPTATGGWIAFLSMPFTYVVAVTAFFAAVGVIGSVRAPLVMHSEPVMTITGGFIFLSQVLAPMQLVGAAFVVAAIFAVRVGGARRAAVAAADN